MIYELVFSATGRTEKVLDIFSAGWGKDKIHHTYKHTKTFIIIVCIRCYTWRDMYCQMDSDGKRLPF